DADCDDESRRHADEDARTWRPASGPERKPPFDPPPRSPTVGVAADGRRISASLMGPLVVSRTVRQVVDHVGETSMGHRLSGIAPPGSTSLILRNLLEHALDARKRLPSVAVGIPCSVDGRPVVDNSGLPPPREAVPSE